MVTHGVQQIHAKNSRGFLLLQIARVTQVDVENYVVRRSAGLLHEPQSEPPMAVVSSRKIPRRNRVHKREKSCRRSTSRMQLVQQLPPFVVQHGLQARLRNIPRPG